MKSQSDLSKYSNNWTFASISSDGIRGEETQRLMKEQNMNYDKAFDRSRKSANKIYNDRFLKLIDETKYLEKGQVHVIYLDKNHHPKNGVIPVT